MVAATLATALALAALALMPAVGPIGGSGLVAAASPDATAGPGGGGDPRSVGEGPGLVGDPLFALALVIGIGVLAAGLTALYVRATGGPRTPPPGAPPSRPPG
ncbi:MAG: hypothetical protein WEF51_03360 [Chloroflexota bacterium]